MLTNTLTELLSAHDIPEPPPAEPMALLASWYDEAKQSKKYDDFNAMSLATATRDGVPSVRMVLCKSVEIAAGAVVFYTNYQSRKGQELETNPRAAGVFHWPHVTRQARFEGIVEHMSPAESDEYFHSRPLLSRIGACVSPQSTPIESRTKLVEAAMTLSKSAALGHAIKRPEHWGGYRIRLTSVELWSGRTGRLHQRIVWKRDVATGEDWKWTYLAP